MQARLILDRLRRGQRPSVQEVNWFAQALGTGEVSEAQAGAFAMAVCWQGLNADGRVALTLGMRDSGEVLSWDLPGPVIDKHSTGGVGDAVSLILAPALAVCGGFVPMISGRGLGHTGGTLDKLEAIPGFRTDLNRAQFQRVVSEVGCAIVAPSVEIAPADKRLYGVRDVTGTVPSLDLITASILSKKLAAGLGGLVLDVKLGSGAFMKSMQDARGLAGSLVSTAQGAGCPTTALITDMDQPLLPSLGNALEVAYVMDLLANPREAPLLTVAMSLGADLLAGCGLAQDGRAGWDRLHAAIWSGQALEKFAEMIAAQGGPPDFIEDWLTHLGKAPVVVPVPSPATGYVAAINGEALGEVVVDLGGGRRRQSDRIDPKVGLSDVARLGVSLRMGQPLARIHAADAPQASRAISAVQAAFDVGPTAPTPGELILERIA